METEWTILQRERLSCCQDTDREGSPLGCVFANDDMAIGGLEAFREHHISVPEQISVVGFDNIHVSQYVSPPLTTFRQPKTDAGLLAGHLLIQMLNGEQVKSVFTLDIQCVERQSVRAVTNE